MRKYLLTSLILFLSAGSFAVQAEENILQQLFEAAREHDDQLQMARARLEEAKGRAQESFAKMFPRVAVDSSLTDTSVESCTGPAAICGDDSRTTRNTISLNQPLYQPDLHRGYKASRARTEQAGYEYGAAYLGLFDRLLQQYLDIMSESDRVRTSQAQRDTLSQQLKSIESRVEAGVASAIDLAEVSAGLQQAESNLIQSRIRLRVFYEGLSESTKLPIKNLPPVRQDLEMPPLDNDNPEYWKEFALRENLSLLAARKGLDAAVQERKQTSRRRLPIVNLFSSYSTSEQEFPDTTSDLTQSQVGISVHVPLFAGGSIFGEVKQNRARVEQLRRQVNLLEIETKVLVPSLVRLIGQGETFIAAARQSMEAAQSTVTQTETLYDAGSSSITELLAAYERRAQTEQNYYAALYSHIRNYADFYIRTAQLNDDQLANFYQMADLSDFNAEVNPLLDE